jgi:hypothetical protein
LRYGCNGPRRRACPAGWQKSLVGSELKLSWLDTYTGKTDEWLCKAR